ncbi:hypothetical protein WICMUC_003957 [Wickerhamomyces mucosus]|uniref:alanine--glyoxylate transaminase n=1 Tax=Wickerhamomyces mucosus TaxID=1378264 RepID=A0A9P8PKL1_9ASCO|nr:hypothetical protein WICMUC_003957 [Wickerhamomyces mucosus]
MSEDLLLIPGPVTVSKDVLKAQSIQSLSHTHPKFISIFQSVLKNLRVLFKSTNPKDQGIVISGSGTLGWDITGSNLVYPDDDVLVLSTGFFSDKFAKALEVYDANVDILTAPVGGINSLQEVETQLKKKKYSVITITHVDTSTAVTQNLANLSKIIKKVSPESLIVIDGVCSVAVEDIEFTKWGLDYVLTGSQKAIGIPPGLSIGFISERAIEKALKRPKQSTYFASLPLWLPILQNYEAGKPSYFATPSIQLINALKVSLDEILNGGLEERFIKSKRVAQDFKKRLTNELGLQLVSLDNEYSASGLTGVYFPEGINGPDFLNSAYKRGVVFAGGIHTAIQPKYFRVGHMGVSALDDSLGHIEKAFDVIKESLAELGYKKIE